MIKNLVEALKEAKLQIEYLDERMPSGTTPAILARIDQALKDFSQYYTILSEEDCLKFFEALE